MKYNQFVESVLLADAIVPASTSVQVNGSYVQAKGAAGVAVFHVGAIAAGGTLTFQIRQAKDSTGTGVKALKAATAFADTDDNKHVIIRFRAEELDVQNGFDYVRIECVAAVAASVIAAELYLYDVRFEPVATTLFAQVV